MTYRYVIGMDVGKYFHHACVLDEHGTQVLSKQVNQHETSLRDLFASFIGKVDQSHDVLVVVDQPNNIGRLTVAIAQSGPNPGKWTRGFNQDAIVSVADPAAS
ncbi:transposase, partial [Corynebacterium sp. KPL3927]|uniref:IS110 family transposase n=1 Tax=Corynebacterium sp. KPL3927 TaxID=3158324 RepID=UPI0032EE4466